MTSITCIQNPMGSAEPRNHHNCREEPRQEHSIPGYPFENSTSQSWPCVPTEGAFGFHFDGRGAPKPKKGDSAAPRTASSYSDTRRLLLWGVADPFGERGPQRREEQRSHEEVRTVTNAMSARSRPLSRQPERRVDEPEPEAEPQAPVHREHDRDDRRGSRAPQEQLESAPQPGLPRKDHEGDEQSEGCRPSRSYRRTVLKAWGSGNRGSPAPARRRDGPSLSRSHC